MPRYAATAVAVLLVALFAAAPSGCTHKEERTLALESFRVTFTPGRGQSVGDASSPLPFVSGRVCGRTACEDAWPCPDGAECVGSCEDTGTPCESDADCLERRACVLKCTTLLHVDIEAVGSDGQPYPYTGPVRLDVTPGFLPPSQSYLKMQGGLLRDVPVYFSSASGRTNIWVEHDGFRRRLDYYGQCNDGVDNDGNGLVDAADPGCLDEYDDIEGKVTGATGVSPDVYFATPDMRSIQWTHSLIHSPLDGQDVTVREGDLVVTNVTNTGLYVTDMRFHQNTLPDGSEGYYHSVFLYTWSTPENVYQGDVLCWFGGGVVEFQGNTQLTFPSFEPFYPGVAECDHIRQRHDLPAEARRNDVLARLGLLVEETNEAGDTVYRLDVDRLTVPISDLLTAEYERRVGADGEERWRPVSDFEDALDANSCALEPFESALVQVEDIEVSTLFVECDQNQNGYIDEGDEATCREQCQQDPLCTELQSYERYKQWAGLVAGRKKMYVNQEMLIDEIPLRIGTVGSPDEDGRCALETFWLGEHLFRRYVCPPMRYESIRGNLRQIYLCGKDYKEGGCGLQLLSLTPTGDRDVVRAAE